MYTDPKMLPFIMTRRQFPVKLAFAMTINKSRGQSFRKVGGFLPSPVFAQGQLYVALSRSGIKENTKILMEDNGVHQGPIPDDATHYCTRNVVYRQVFDD